MSVSAQKVRLVDATTGNDYNPSQKQETFTLCSNNTPSSATTVFGGDYIFSQQASAYGTINLQALAADGVTWQTILSKTASDNGSGTGVALGSYAQVRVTVSGTTAAYATLSRVPS